MKVEGRVHRNRCLVSGEAAGADTASFPAAAVL